MHDILADPLQSGPLQIFLNPRHIFVGHLPGLAVTHFAEDYTKGFLKIVIPSISS